MSFNFNDIDPEVLLDSEGYNYRLSSGSSGLQLHIETCPHCRKDEWKVYANAETFLGNCFQCGFKFNMFTFILAARNLSKANTYKYLSDFATQNFFEPRQRKSFSPKINKDWVLPLNKKILSNEDIPEYLVKRNIDLKIATRFDLRVCENGFYIYENYHEKKIAVDFSSRILIPIVDIDGNQVTFQGRDYSGVSSKRYLFPNMLPSSGAFIYNADYALKNNFKKIILNEGAFDVYATTQAIESDVTFSDFCACGTWGKHLSVDLSGAIAKDQLSDLYRLKANGLEEIIILWDGEIKAIIAAMETAIKLGNLGFKVKVGILPLNKDPAEVSREEVLKSLKEAQEVNELTLMKYRLLNA